MSYLTILDETNALIAQKNSFLTSLHSFEQLIIQLRPNEYIIQPFFAKNLNFFKEILKSKKNDSVPEISEVADLYRSIFSSKDFIRKFFLNIKIIIIWLISVYESQYNLSFEEFENYHWEKIAFYIPNLDSQMLKFKFFMLTTQKSKKKTWTLEQESTLTRTMKNLYPALYDSNSKKRDLKISWIKVSFEFCKDIEKLLNFKTNRQCKEKWFNHLNPFLKKGVWSTEEDIQLMECSLLTPKKWAQISKCLTGRNQHQIKNRFISVLTKEMMIPKKKIRILIKENSIIPYIEKTLKILNLEKNNSLEKNSLTEQNDKIIFDEEKKDESFVLVKKKENFNRFKNVGTSWNIDQFINFIGFEFDLI